MINFNLKSKEGLEKIGKVLLIIAFVAIASYTIFDYFVVDSEEESSSDIADFYSPGGIIEGSPHKDLTYAHYSPNRKNVINYNEGHSVKINDAEEFTDFFKALPVMFKPGEIQVTYWINDEELVFFYEDVYSLPNKVINSGASIEGNEVISKCK